MSTYRITFDRIGRTHNPPSIDVTTTTNDPFDELAEAAYIHARKFLRSRHADVLVNSEPEADGGHRVLVIAGISNGGDGIAREITEETP